MLKGTCNLNKFDVIIAYDHLIDNIKDLHKEHKKIIEGASSMTVFSADIDALLNEGTTKIYDLETKLALVTPPIY